MINIKKETQDKYFSPIYKIYRINICFYNYNLLQKSYIGHIFIANKKNRLTNFLICSK
jgi:hypothetical protein